MGVPQYTCTIHDMLIKMGSDSRLQREVIWFQIAATAWVRLYLLGIQCRQLISYLVAKFEWQNQKIASHTEILNPKLAKRDYRMSVKKLTVCLSSLQFPIKTPGANFCSILHPGMDHFMGSPCAIVDISWAPYKKSITFLA